MSPQVYFNFQYIHIHHFVAGRKLNIKTRWSAVQTPCTCINRKIVVIIAEKLFTGVAMTMMGEILVADSKNKRIQTFTRRKLFKDSFLTNDEPYSVAVDVHYNVIVATKKKTIEIYRRGGKLINRFSTMPNRDQVRPISNMIRFYFVGQTISSGKFG